MNKIPVKGSRWQKQAKFVNTILIRAATNFPFSLSMYKQSSNPKAQKDSLHIEEYILQLQKMVEV
jgi:hypothetical protein